MMAWIPFSLVSCTSFPLAAGLVKVSAETVRRSWSWMSWMVSVLMKTVLMEVEMRGSTQVMVGVGGDGSVVYLVLG